MRRKLIIDDDALRAAVVASWSYNGIAIRLFGCNASVRLSNRIRRRIDELGLDTAHLRGRGPRPHTWTDDQLRDAVTTSRSVAQTIRKLGLIAAGGNYDQVQQRMRELQLDSSHFTGQGWNVGGTFVPTPPRPLDEILVANRWCGSHWLKNRLFREGLKKPQCELCGWAQRAPDGRIPVELDHINGDKNDNRFENLRILCPNCHSLQPTHRGMNKKTARRARMV